MSQTASPATASTGQRPAPPATQELQLADIHLPAQPALWPPAWGWWVLLALLLALLSLLWLKYRRYRQRQQHSTRILQALDTLAQRLRKEQSNAAIADLNILLRRLALTYYPRQQVASLTGQQWLEFLDQSGHTRDFTRGAGRILADAPYATRVPESVDINALVKVIRKWVKQISRQQGGRVQ